MVMIYNAGKTKCGYHFFFFFFLWQDSNKDDDFRGFFRGLCCCFFLEDAVCFSYITNITVVDFKFSGGWLEILSM